MCRCMKLDASSKGYVPGGSGPRSCSVGKSSARGARVKILVYICMYMFVCMSICLSTYMHVVYAVMYVWMYACMSDVTGLV